LYLSGNQNYQIW